jgi:hypothetical protein
MSPSPKRNTRKNAAPDAVGVLDIHAGLAAHALIMAVIMAEGGGRGGARSAIQYRGPEIAALAYQMALAMQGARMRYGLGVRHET